MLLPRGSMLKYGPALGGAGLGLLGIGLIGMFTGSSMVFSIYPYGLLAFGSVFLGWTTQVWCAPQPAATVTRHGNAVPWL